METYEVQFSTHQECEDNIEWEKTVENTKIPST